MKTIIEAYEERKMANEELVLLDIVIEPGMKGVDIRVQSDILESFFSGMCKDKKFKLTTLDGRQQEFYHLLSLDFLDDEDQRFFFSPNGSGKDYLEIDGRFNLLPLLMVGMKDGASYTFAPCGNATRKRLQEEYRSLVEHLARNLIFPPSHKMRITVEKTSQVKAA